MIGKKPNIVLVTMDTARAGNFSCYGYERKTSPFLDKLAEENVKYERVISQENWTLPSHASMFTGKYVSDHGITGTQSFSEIDSFTDDLSERGYDTIAFTNVAFLTEEFDADELFDNFTYVRGSDFFSDLDIEGIEFRSREDLSRYLDLLSEIVSSGNLGKFFSGSRKFLGRRLLLRDSGAKKTNELVKKKLSNKEDPFFLFLNYTEPHTPYLPPFPHSHKFLDDKLRWNDIVKRANKSMKHFMWVDEDPEPEQLEVLESLYDGSIRYLDSMLENLYEFISTEFPNTVFIFTSDHGEYFYEHESLIDHGKGFHSQVNNVPLIEVFPDDISEDISSPVELKSLSNHILAIAEETYDVTDSNGIALSEDIRSEGRDQPLKFSEKYGFYGVSVQDKDYKLVWYSSGKKELLRMPEEELIKDKEKVEYFSKIIEERVGNPEVNDYRRGSVDPKDDEIKEKLKHLGYI